MASEQRNEALCADLRRWAEQPEWALHIRYELPPQHRARELRKRIAQIRGRLLRFWGLSRGWYQSRQWESALKHGSSSGNMTLLVWSDLTDREKCRAACAGFQRFLLAHPQYVPVLVTPLADFAFYSRLGWLVEYLPEIPGEGPDYAERKRRYLAWRYRHAEVVPLSAGLGNEIEASLREPGKSILSLS